MKRFFAWKLQFVLSVKVQLPIHINIYGGQSGNVCSSKWVQMEWEPFKFGN